MDGGGPELAVVPAECAGAGCKHRGYFGADGSAGSARTNFGKAAARRGGREHHETKIFSRNAWKDRGRTSGHFANGLYGRSGIRDLDAVARRGEGAGRSGVGCKERRGTGAGWAGDKLERSRSALRQVENGTTSA